MADICVERFPAGHAEEDCAQDNKSPRAVVDEKLQSMNRIDRMQDAGFIENLAAAENTDRDKPQYGHRSKNFSDAGGAAGLKKEERDQNRDRHGNYIRIKEWRREMQSFDRAQDRDRRRDHPVGIQQGRPKEPKEENKLPAPYDFADQGGKGENSAFAPIIRPQNQDQIFDRNDENE